MNLLSVCVIWMDLVILYLVEPVTTTQQWRFFTKSYFAYEIVYWWKIILGFHWQPRDVRPKLAVPTDVWSDLRSSAGAGGPAATTVDSTRRFRPSDRQRCSARNSHPDLVTCRHRFLPESYPIAGQQVFPVLFIVELSLKKGTATNDSLNYLMITFSSQQGHPFNIMSSCFINIFNFNLM